VRRAALTAALIVATMLAPAVARARTTRVTTPAELTSALAAGSGIRCGPQIPGSGTHNACLTPMYARAHTWGLTPAQPGERIRLAAGAHGQLAGRGGAAAGPSLQREAGALIAISGLAVEPAGAPALVRVTSSHGVTFRGLSADGGWGGARVSTEIAADATGVVIADSTFLHCPSPYCIRTIAPDIVIRHTTFDDLGDAVHGFGGGVIRADHMDHALLHGEGNYDDFTVLRNGRIVARTARAASGAALTLALGTPRRGELVVRARALGSGGGALRAVTRTAPA
jgi:hypothetical protein